MKGALLTFLSVLMLSQNEPNRVVPTDPEDNVSRIHEAVTLASDSDVAVLVVGDNKMNSCEDWGRMGGR